MTPVTAAHAHVSVSTIVGITFVVFLAGAGWIASRVSKAPPELRSHAVDLGKPSLGGLPPAIGAFVLWGFLCIGGMMLAIILATGSPFPGGGGSSSSSPTSRRVPSSPHLSDLQPTSASATFDTVGDALLVRGGGGGPQTVELSLDGRYRELDATVRMRLGTSGLTGSRAMEISLSSDASPTPMTYEVVPGPPMDARPLPLTHAHVLRIQVIDRSQSVNDEAVIGGVVKP